MEKICGFDDRAKILIFMKNFMRLKCKIISNFSIPFLQATRDNVVPSFA